MLEVVLTLCALFGAVYCYTVFTFALSVPNKLSDISRGGGKLLKVLWPWASTLNVPLPPMDKTSTCKCFHILLPTYFTPLFCTSLVSPLSLSLSLPVSDVSDVEVFGLITRIVRLYVGPSLSVAFNTISLVRIPSGIGVVM